LLLFHKAPFEFEPQLIFCSVFFLFFFFLFFFVPGYLVLAPKVTPVFPFLATPLTGSSPLLPFCPYLTTLQATVFCCNFPFLFLFRRASQFFSSFTTCEFLMFNPDFDDSVHFLFLASDPFSACHLLAFKGLKYLAYRLFATT